MLNVFKTSNITKNLSKNDSKSQPFLKIEKSKIAMAKSKSTNQENQNSPKSENCLKTQISKMIQN